MKNNDCELPGMTCETCIFLGFSCDGNNCMGWEGPWGGERGTEEAIAYHEEIQSREAKRHTTNDTEDNTMTYTDENIEKLCDIRIERQHGVVRITDHQTHWYADEAEFNADVADLNTKRPFEEYATDDWSEYDVFCDEVRGHAGDGVGDEFDRLESLFNLGIIITPTDEDRIHRYPGQSKCQTVYLYLDRRDRSAEVDWDSEIGNAVPASVFHRHVRRYEIPCDGITAEGAVELLEDMATELCSLLIHLDDEDSDYLEMEMEISIRRWVREHQDRLITCWDAGDFFDNDQPQIREMLVRCEDEHDVKRVKEQYLEHCDLTNIYIHDLDDWFDTLHEEAQQEQYDYMDQLSSHGVAEQWREYVWGDDPQGSEDIVTYDGDEYMVTQGTGDGSYAYLVTDVREWIKQEATSDNAALDEEGIKAYQRFCDARVCQVQTGEDLAKAIWKAIDVLIDDGGSLIWEPESCDRCGKVTEQTVPVDTGATDPGGYPVRDYICRDCYEENGDDWDNA